MKSAVKLPDLYGRRERGMLNRWVSWTTPVLAKWNEPWFNLPHLSQVASCCLFDLVTVVFNHYNYKNSFNNKKTNRTSDLEDFMTAASDAEAKAL